MIDAIAVGFVDERNQAVEDEALAATCTTTTMLITADVLLPWNILPAGSTGPALVRRLHLRSSRRPGLPIDRTMLTQTCGTLVDIVGGGSLLITDVEHMPAFVQNCLIETFAGLQSAREPACRMCLIAGTTTILHDRIADGRFSERLFYQLNTIHVVKDGRALPISPMTTRG